VRGLLSQNRIGVEYLSFQATLGHVESLRTAAAPRRRPTRPWRIAFATTSACLAVTCAFILAMKSGAKPGAEAIAEFHRFVELGRQPADCTYRVTFVKDT